MMSTAQIANNIMVAALEFMAAKASTDVASIILAIDVNPTGPAAKRYEELCRLGLQHLAANA